MKDPGTLTTITNHPAGKVRKEVDQRKEVAKSKDCGVVRETKKIIANKEVDDKKGRSIVLKRDKETG